MKTDEMPVLAMLGVYEDQFVRTDRGWCMALRRVLAGGVPATPSS